MLLSEDGCGNEHADLFSAHHGFEGSADCHLRFPKADVAAHQAVHRRGVLHVFFHVNRRLCLVWRVFVHERRLHLFLPMGVRRKCESFLRLATRVEGNQLAGNIFDAFAGS